ncbi:MAG TPA: aminotransferase class III-fold pyridoxal phosphate-dependent enzyme [Casimicrobiaceae bacterium]|nr:aminotransferase class III-fold pyridoxal phosphate-dependent enzyme [Casimicrobiaceae bacterium]
MGHSEFTLRNQPSQKPLSLDELWMPFTPNRDFKSDPRIVVRAEGLYYYTDRGDKIIDASSGLFCVAAGHCRQEIADAVHRQLQELDFVAPFMRAHPKSFELASRVAELTPGDLNRIFFVNSGSEAVDTAMKVALAYHQARGQTGRTMFVSRERAYHGVNFGGVALSGIVNNRRKYGPGIAGDVHMRHTQLPENRVVQGQPEHGADLADDLLRFVTLYGAENIAACFVEPIAGSTGCLVPPKGYLERLRQICDTHGILLVFDEVITGFGRTGQPFAGQSFGVTPDLMTMAKALTNAAQPMGAVAVSERVHDTIMAAAQEGAIEFFHGYTYSGHPAACAAGLATLDLYRTDGLFERARELSPYFQQAMFSLKGTRNVTDVRGYGMFATFDVESDGMPGRRGNLLQKKLFDNGLNLKNTGDAALVAPPFIAERKDIDMMVDILQKTVSML